MKLFKSLIVITTSLFFILGCSGNGPQAGGDEFPSTGTSVNVTEDTPLYMYVQTQYETGSAAEPIYYHGICNIDPAAAVGTRDTCNISIPEGMLRYSKTLFTVGTVNATRCPRIEFEPYYRHVSSTPYTAIGDDSDTDCATTPLDPKCFDGAAGDIIGADFPKKATSLWFSTDETTSISKTVNAANARSYDNTRVCNNYPAASRGTPVVIGGYPVYEGDGVFRDYVIRCLDAYDELLYQITITIDDVDFDPAGVGSNHWYDWY